jgi:outer membrane protein assembly factor BamB
MTRTNKKIALIGLISILVTSSFLTFYLGRLSTNYCKSFKPGFSRTGENSILDQTKVSPGYTLFTTFGIAKKTTKEEQRVYLIDMNGKLVHSWQTSYPPFYAKMKKNGNLIVSQMSPESKKFKWITSPLIQELNWEGQVVWEYQNNLQHHDFDMLPNSNLAMLIYQKVPSEIAALVKGGIIKSNDNEDVYSDSIIEVNNKGEIVWQWDMYKHLNPQTDILGDSDLHSDWTHSNSIQYLEKDPIKEEEAYLISVRNLSFIAIISKKDGEIIWRSKAGSFDHQHDATYLENGNILVFDNGFDIHSKTEALLGSRVSEINPKTDEIVWQFKGDNPLTQSHFFNSVLGGAQKLKNGNILITLGTNGELLEVTPDKKIVWDYINPYVLDSDPGEFAINYIFKARRIYEDDIDWPAKLDQPIDEIPFFCKI